MNDLDSLAGRRIRITSPNGDARMNDLDSLAGREGFVISSPNGDARMNDLDSLAGREGFVISSPNGDARMNDLDSLAGREAFEYHPFKGDARMNDLDFLAGREGFEPSAEFNPSTHLAGEPNRPLWHLPRCSGLYFTRKIRSGGSGIRTHVGVTQTCFQDMRLRPLGHPSGRGDFTTVEGGEW